MAATDEGPARPLREIDRHLIAGLARGMNWMDNSLQNILRSRGYTPVHRTQSLILLHIACGIDSPADIAREMGLTRQNVHQMARSLIELGLIEQSLHPADPRRSKYQWSSGASEIRREALGILESLEEVVKSRSGAGDEEMLAFHKILGADWGPLIGSDEELLSAAETQVSSRRGKSRNRNTGD